MTDLLTRMERNRKEAGKFSDLAKSAASSFLRAYYWRIAERYLSFEAAHFYPSSASCSVRAVCGVIFFPRI
jgi:hypothetical protein